MNRYVDITDYVICTVDRVKSRVLLVPFGLPLIGPTTSDDCHAFESFEAALQNASYNKAVGWLVHLRALLFTEGKHFIQETNEKLRDCFGMKVRSTVGWSVCLFFVNQVSPLMFIFPVMVVLKYY